MVSDQTRLILLRVTGNKSKPIPGRNLVYGFLTTAPNAGEPGEERDVLMRAAG